MKLSKDIQKHLLHSLTNMIYRMITNPNFSHDEISFTYDGNDISSVEKELELTWIFKCVKLIVESNTVKLDIMSVKDIIDKCVVFGKYRDGLDKVSVRVSDDFIFEIFFNLESTSEEFLKNELELKGIPICNGYVDYDINTTNNEVCINLNDSVYLVRTKK